MSYASSNQTNPAIIEATGYTPYHKKREKLTYPPGTQQHKANARAQASRDFWNRVKATEELSRYAKDHDANLFRNKWECEADKKALYSRVRWEMDKITTEMEKELEQRKARLADLIKSEESEYLDELSTSREDPEEKHERMMHRYTNLKTQKETERGRIAKEKKEQQFKRNCDELRTLVSEQIQKMTVDDARKIIKEKEQEALERNLEDKMYTEFWAKDREAKDLKDAQEEEEKRRKNMENGKFIREQMLMNELEKQKRVREKDHDHVVMNELARLVELEEQYGKDQKKKNQAEFKRDLDQCTREKLKRRAKEVQDDLVQDLFFLNQIAESTEEAERCEKKRALMHEQQQYLKYLKERIQAEADFEKEVDRLYQEELENVWKKREQEWEREKKKRRELEKDVINEVQEQIRQNLGKAKRIQAYNQAYSQKVVEEDIEDRKKAKEKLLLIREKNEANQRELLEQMKMKQEELERQKMKRDMELELLRRDREEENRKIQELLAEVQIDNEHPFRTMAKRIC